MKRMREYTALLKVRVFYTGGVYTLNVESGNNVKAPRQYVFRGDHDSFVRFLMGIKAKDNKTWPRSVRGERYADIATEIENGSDQIIYVWEHDYMRYLNRKNANESVSRKNEATLTDVIDLYRYLSDNPRWEVFDDRPDLKSFSYKGKVFIDFTKDEKGIIYEVAVRMSNSVGDVSVEVDAFGVKRIDVSKGLMSFRNKAGDEINVFLR